VADNEHNTVIVSGPPESVRLVEELLDQLDVRPRQVHISTIIGQMSLNNERQVGVSAYSTLRELNHREHILGAGSLFTGALKNPVAFPSLDDINNGTTEYPSLTGMTLYGQIAEDLNVYLRLMENSNRFKLLSRPSIFTANNKKAVIQSGQRIAVPTNSITNLNNVNGSVTSNIDYRDVVLKLEVIPQINSENEVTLQIAQVNDQVIGTQTVAGNEVPIISTEELLTTVTVADGQTIILGGLITEQTEKVVDGVPVLMHVPILKHLFSTTRNAKKRSELLIFIQPKIVDSEKELIDTNVDEINRTERGEEAVEFAVPEFEEYREGLPRKAKLIDGPSLFGDFEERQ
jgi:type II secretory pathway component GspD/PulD (secretin)